jgi:hypothetical protein
MLMMLSNSNMVGRSNDIFSPILLLESRCRSFESGSQHRLCSVSEGGNHRSVFRLVGGADLF